VGDKTSRQRLTGGSERERERERESSWLQDQHPRWFTGLTRFGYCRLNSCNFLHSHLTFLPLRPKYNPRYPVLRHLQPALSCTLLPSPDDKLHHWTLQMNTASSAETSVTISHSRQRHKLSTTPPTPTRIHQISPNTYCTLSPALTDLIIYKYKWPSAGRTASTRRGGIAPLNLSLGTRRKGQVVGFTPGKNPHTKLTFWHPSFTFKF
jgi:hypothetical protein